MSDIHPSAIIVGPVELGEGVRIFPGVIIGFDAEHLSAETDWDRPIVIGPGAVLRENVVVQRGTVGGEGTRIDAGAYIMHGCHVAHDCHVGPGARMAPKGVLGGHVVVEGMANLGIGAMIHPRVRVGALSMVGMGAVVTKDVAVATTVAGVPARVRGENTVGVERAGATPEELAALREAWRLAR